MKPDTIDIIELLDKLKNNQNRQIKHERKINHYTYEILRNWNKINIIHKNLLKKNKSQSFEDTLSFYIIFRVKWENANTREILEEIQGLVPEGKERNILKNKIIQNVKDIIEFSWDFLFHRFTPEARLSLKTATPSFVIDRLNEYLPLDVIQEILETMYKSIRETKQTLRINKIKADNEKIDSFLKLLRKKKIETIIDEHYSYLLLIQGDRKEDIIKTNFYSNGESIFQNKASVVSIEVMEPKEEDLIWDMCSAPGLKTTLISQKTKNKARIISTDFKIDRVKTLSVLVEKLGSINTMIINCDSINPPFKNGTKFNKILLDPPCTGSGTFSSNPELKLRQNYSFLNQNKKIQERLLLESIDYLKDGGLLIYSTCSLYYEEGEEQILKIIEYFKPVDLPKWISKSYEYNKKQIRGTGRLFPHVQDTQGFFIAKLQKEKPT
ncbi:MAG: RsmB/NOP family class I SAM-dependent RNA methyltransferase [Candidatus Ranarchaeia archaeon]